MPHIRRAQRLFVHRRSAPCRLSPPTRGSGSHPDGGVQALRSRRGGGNGIYPGQARAAAAAAGRSAPRRQRAGGRAAAEPGQAARPRAGREAARSRLLRRARPLRQAPGGRVRDAGAAPVRRRRRHGLRNDFQPPGLRLLAGLHRFRRQPLRGLRRQDLQGHGPGREVRLPRDRDQRLGWRSHPGGRRLPGGLRGDLLAERAELGRDPAAQFDHGPVRGRRRLLPRDDGFRPDGRGELVHVHHRPRCREDGHRRGGDVRGARRRGDPCFEVRGRALHRAERGGVPRGRALPALRSRRIRPRGRTPSSTR